jgi:hypothetical protein
MEPGNLPLKWIPATNLGALVRRIADDQFARGGNEAFDKPP